MEINDWKQPVFNGKVCLVTSVVTRSISIQISRPYQPCNLVIAYTDPVDKVIFWWELFTWLFTDDFLSVSLQNMSYIVEQDHV
jgi:hypothetical protein